MKVNGPYRPAALDTTRGIVRRKDGDDSRTSTTETVQVSSEAQALAQARAPESPDMPKVQKLRESIENGTFKPDAERIADAMLREER